MRTKLLAALGFAASLALSATAGIASTVITSIAAPLAASPTPVDFSGGENVFMAGSLSASDDTADFTFTALDTLQVDSILINLNGLLADVTLVDITIDNGATIGFDNVLALPGSPSVFRSVGFDSFTMSAGETVTVTFDASGGTLMVGVPIAFNLSSTAISPVPLPAGLPLLLTAAGGLALLRARRAA